MQFIEHPNNASPTLTAILGIGDISPGDTEKLIELLHNTGRKKNTAIYLASPGGDLYEGMRLGLFFRSARIKTVVEGGMDCASACALAFLGGTDNNGRAWRSSSTNSRLGFHAFSGYNLSQNDVQRVVADILSYGKNVDAPIDLLIVNFATPSEDISWVSQSELCALGIKLWSVSSDSFVCNE
jgi:hypothetical protein